MHDEVKPNASKLFAFSNLLWITSKWDVKCFMDHRSVVVTWNMLPFI